MRLKPRAEVDKSTRISAQTATGIGKNKIEKRLVNKSDSEFKAHSVSGISSTIICQEITAQDRVIMSHSLAGFVGRFDLRHSGAFVAAFF
jgi:hypothetical protein